ncbi:hypothetical protein SAMN05443246_1079 [Paenibacillus sp. GP183]|jgi:hypothetical protein|nr:hypothetical protein SAMN05443246_1079 [Paenibacillus sp. GP183]
MDEAHSVSSKGIVYLAYGTALLYSFLPHAPWVILVPTAFMLPLWFLLIARFLARR